MRLNKKIVLLVIIIIAAGGGALAYSLQRTPEPASHKTADTASPAPTAPQPATPTTPTIPPEDADKVTDYEVLTENERFKIRHDAENDRYIITLYAIINRPDQYELYKEDLHTYKHEALEYLQTSGRDTNALDIKYEPEEATDL